MTSQGEGLTREQLIAKLDDTCTVDAGYLKGIYYTVEPELMEQVFAALRTPPTGKCETALTLLAEATNDIDAATWCHGPKWVEKVTALLSASPDCQPTGITESEREALEHGAESIEIRMNRARVMFGGALSEEAQMSALRDIATLRALCAKLGGQT